MNGSISVGKAGLVLGSVIGAWHVGSVLVAAGVAQIVIDFVLWIHFIKPVYVIEPFDLGRAAILVVVTAALGFVVGSVFAMIWNAIHKA